MSKRRIPGQSDAANKTQTEQPAQASATPPTEPSGNRQAIMDVMFRVAEQYRARTGGAPALLDAIREDQEAASPTGGDAMRGVLS